MPLNELLNARRISIMSGTQDRAAVINAAARLLATPAAGEPVLAVHAAPELALIGDSLRARERLASTAIGHGVAIPHGRVDFIDDSRGAFLRLAEPVDFGAADGAPVDLILAMLVPQHSTTMIRELISAENPRKPLSDARLAEALKATGIPVARRTVAKYREALGIASSQDRVRMA